MDRQFFAQNIKQRGQAFMVAVLLILLGLLALIILASNIASRGIRISELDFRSKRAYFLAESGIEDAVFRLKRGKGISSSYTLSFYGEITTVTLTTVPGGREIHSEASVKNSHRIVQSTVAQGTGAGFAYAVQIGQGGIDLENNAQIIGSVYSDGNISGKNISQITQDAFAAGTSIINGENSFTIQGNARAHGINNVTISKSASSTTYLTNSDIGINAYANSISSSDITKDAYYLTSITSSQVGGSTFPGTPPPADLLVIPFPISDAQIDQWKTSAEAGGIYTGPCPYVLTEDTTDLGPIKINCDFSAQNTAIVNVKGTIWVSGNFELRNSAQLRLDPFYGSFSEALIADNISNRLTSSTIEIEDSSQVLGSGAPNSYLALISRNNSAENGGTVPAIQPKNNVDASIYYAPHGLIQITNSSALKEVTAYQLKISNDAVVTYESGLASTQFAGPTGGIDIVNWREAE